MGEKKGFFLSSIAFVPPFFGAAGLSLYPKCRKREWVIAQVRGGIE